MLKLFRTGEKSRVPKINGKEIKEVHTFVYLENMVEKNGKIQNEINKEMERLQNHLANSLLWSRDTDRKNVKL